MGFPLRLTPAAITPLSAPQNQGYCPGLPYSCSSPRGWHVSPFPAETPLWCPAGTRRKGGRAGGALLGSGVQGPARSRAEGKDFFTCLSNANPVYTLLGDASSPWCDTVDSCSAREPP